MSGAYNRIAGGSHERLAALSDGVFAVAMTLLVLDLHVPAADTIRSEADLLAALGRLLPNLLIYAMSFLTLGIFWIGQQAQISRLGRSNRALTWIHLAFLFAVTLMPFATQIVADFTPYRIAIVIYWLNILALGALLLAAWRYTVRTGLLHSETTRDYIDFVERRIVVAQALYAASVALCAFSPYWSIGAILLLQLNYAVAPRLPARLQH